MILTTTDPLARSRRTVGQLSRVTFGIHASIVHGVEGDEMSGVVGSEDDEISTPSPTSHPRLRVCKPQASGKTGLSAPDPDPDPARTRNIELRCHLQLEIFTLNRGASEPP